MLDVLSRPMVSVACLLNARCREEVVDRSPPVVSENESGTCAVSSFQANGLMIVPGRYTVLLRAGADVSLTVLQAERYASAKGVESVVVLWDEDTLGYQPPTLVVGDVFVSFAATPRAPVPPPNLKVSTEAVLLVDYFVKIELGDVERAFEAWESSKNSIVGIFGEVRVSERASERSKGRYFFVQRSTANTTAGVAGPRRF